jgi:hypothetical protein
MGADCVLNWCCQYLALKRTRRPTRILSERHRRRAGEKSDSHYGSCDFAMHLSLLIVLRMIALSNAQIKLQFGSETRIMQRVWRDFFVSLVISPM